MSFTLNVGEQAAPCSLLVQGPPCRALYLYLIFFFSFSLLCLITRENNIQVEMSVSACLVPVIPWARVQLGAGNNWYQRKECHVTLCQRYPHEISPKFCLFVPIFFKSNHDNLPFKLPQNFDGMVCFPSDFADGVLT